MTLSAVGTLDRPTWRATVQRLHALQAPRVSDVPSGCFSVDANYSRPGDIFGDITIVVASCTGNAPDGDGGGTGDAGVGSKTHDALRTAKFWIALQEGELQELHEELAKQKDRHKEAVRQAEAKASSLRESEVERKRLQAELQRLQQARTEAICKLNLQSQDVERKKEDADSLAARAESLERELNTERAQKTELEEQLVKVKVRYAEALQRADTLEAALEHYEGQLKSYNPSFEPLDLASFGRRLRTQESESETENDSEVVPPVADAPVIRLSVELKKGFGSGFKSGFRKMFGGASASKNRKEREDIDEKEREDPEPQVNPQFTPRDAEARSARPDSPMTGEQSTSPVGEAPFVDKPTGRRKRWEMRVD